MTILEKILIAKSLIYTATLVMFLKGETQQESFWLCVVKAWLAVEVLAIPAYLIIWIL